MLTLRKRGARFCVTAFSLKTPNSLLGPQMLDDLYCRKVLRGRSSISQIPTQCWTRHSVSVIGQSSPARTLVLGAANQCSEPESSSGKYIQPL